MAITRSTWGGPQAPCPSKRKGIAVNFVESVARLVPPFNCIVHTLSATLPAFTPAVTDSRPMHGFFAWIQDAAHWLLHVAREHPQWAFAIAFGSAFGESFVGISFLVPGTTILVGLGALLQAAGINPVPIWLGAAIGAILGDWVSYWIGHHYKEHALALWPVSRFPRQMEKALMFFRRWGIWAIFLGRFTGPLRATVPIVAGISQMAFWHGRGQLDRGRFWPGSPQANQPRRN